MRGFRGSGCHQKVPTLESQLRSVGNFAEMGFGVNNLGLALTPANL